MIFVDVDKTKTYLSKLIERVRAGEVSSEPRTPGLLAGRIEIAPDFDDPAPVFAELFGR
jgi:hypothetical protein